MSTPLLAAKLYIPPPRPKALRRGHLIERLNQGMFGKLTLISAPAGFGKTTLAGEWIAMCGRPVAWLSLDDEDNDPSRFLTYLIAALQTISEQVAASVMTTLQIPSVKPDQSILTALLNEIASVPHRFTLVLDDYHVLEDEAVNSILSFLLEYLPPQMHLVIITREDPPLPLARMRARGELTELRAADLRFKSDEAANFLNQVMGLDLSSEDVASLETRTEGWIAGLQLAALSMQGREDIHSFIKAFAGDHRYIVDYLVDEVLNHQPEAVRRFLLQTSILDRLCGPLCDAVTSQTSGSVVLEKLERGNLFVVPLDDKRFWFRYHHLFADVLRIHLMDEQPEFVAILHQRASDWHMSNGFPAKAVQHAFVARDFQGAARLIELTWSAMDRSRQFAMWLGWVRSLPDELISVRPVLSVGYAWALLEDGELEAGEVQLNNAEKLLNTPSAEMIIDDETEFQLLPASIASAHTYMAQAQGDIPATLKYARQALDLLPADDHLRRGIPASLLGIASWASGDLATAEQSFADAMTSFEIAGNILFAITGTYVLADIQLAQGQLRKAFQTYEKSFQLAAEQGEPPIQGTADLYLGLSELHHEQGNEEAATQGLLKSQELSERAAFPRWQYRWCLVQARIKRTQGDLDGALEMLDEAERLYVRGPIPDIQSIAALKAQIWIIQGKLDAALAWAREQELSAADELSYLREFEHITLARLLIAQHIDGVESAIDEAMALLEHLLESAQAGGRNGSVIEILVQQALAYEAQGDVTHALMPLECALTLAEPEGYIRIFADEGAPMAHLLSKAVECGVMPGYTRQLLAALESPSGSAPSPTIQPLVEPLSERELEILYLVAEGFSNREISEQLYLALSTVKGHNRNIFDKLQVKRRTEAVARARELGLI